MDSGVLRGVFALAGTPRSTDRETANGGSESDEMTRTGQNDRTASTQNEQPETVRSTGRWRGIVTVSLLALAVGILAKRPSLLLVAAVGVAFVAYPRITSVPNPDLSVSRRVNPESADEGDIVDVHTTIRNEGEETLFDLRVIDGTPPMLSVCGGSPRCASALRPGGEVTLEYELRARPGRHQFQPTTLLCRDASGSIEIETAATAESPIECAARVPTVPLRARSRHRTGPLVTNEGGSGLEFHTVEEYKRGDPASRIDWRRFARTGELTSVAFRTERLADVVICVDARPEAYRASAATEPHAVVHAVDAAGRIGDALFDANHRVGLAAFGSTACVLSPGSGRDHSDRFHRHLATDPALTLVPPPSTRGADTRFSIVSPRKSDANSSLDCQLSRILTQIGSNTQVILLTPMCDEEASLIAHRFESVGTAVTVVSPDVTTDRTVGSRLVRLERDHRLTAVRNAGIPVVDWDPEESLGVALAAVERLER